MTALSVKKAVQTAMMCEPDGKIGPVTIGAFNRLKATPDDAAWPPEQDPPKLIGEIGGVKIYRDRMGVVSYMAGATIDADGAPDCYHPDDSKGLDYLANAGRPGYWWGIVTDTDHAEGSMGRGRPLIQGETAPAFHARTVGFYVSTTALPDNPEFPISDCRRYTNPLEVRFIVLPKGFPVKVRLGAAVRVTFDGVTLEGIYADIGPADHLGEMSVKYAQDLGIPSSPKTGGMRQRVIRYEIPT